MTVWPPIGLLAPPALGIARAALDELIELDQTRTPELHQLDDARAPGRAAPGRQAEANLSAGRAFLHVAFAAGYAAAVAGPVELEHKLRMQLARSRAVACAAATVDLVHAAAGASTMRQELS